MKKKISNKTLAIFGVGVYILSVLAHVEDLERNYVATPPIILLHAIAAIIFTVMAISRLWGTRKITSALLLVTSVITLAYVIPFVRGLNTVVFIWVIWCLWTMSKHEAKLSFENITQELEERAMKGAVSNKNYDEKTFEKIWELANFSDDEILGINWNEKDKEKIEKQLVALGLKLRHSKSPTLISFGFELGPGDIVDGTISLPKNRSIVCLFSFIDKKADKLKGWIEKKYGKSLEQSSGFKDETVSESYHIWDFGDVSISVALVKLSGLADITFSKKITPEEFLKTLEMDKKK